MKKPLMNWGNGIAIAIVIFVLFIGSLVYISFRQKINLVSRDYYPKELNHSAHMEKVKNYQALSAPIKIDLDEAKYLQISFPADFRGTEIKGRAQLYYFVDFEEDHFYPLEVDHAGKQIISLKNLKSGRYKLILDWVAHAKTYYCELELQIP